jgi:hypothetical protein
VKIHTSTMMKTKSWSFIVVFLNIFSVAALHADPQLNSWFTSDSGRYARIYTTDAAKASQTTSTAWTNGTTSQELPAYCGIQEVDYSSNWIYIRSTGLGSHVMGPWYLDAQHTQLFPNWPINEKVLYRIPRTPTVPTTKTANGGGPIGYFVDGAAMFNSWDAYYWNGTQDVQSSGGAGYWNRDAYVNEGVSFDPNNAHQANGQYHYHANPPALRYLLGDNVDYNSTTDTYAEDPSHIHHSPILAWVSDGYPLYGPYGYSNPTNPASAVRRMISGYIIRNGLYGTSNLTANDRTTIPAWAVRLYDVSSNQTGPNVSGSYPLGRYMEDNDYLGDHGYTQGVDFDLDEYNGRFCVTPEFPNGTYAYFVSISSNGTPVFPYNIGRGYHGSPTGGNVTSISETVTTNFLGGTNMPCVLNAPGIKNGTVTLSWSAVEGGAYTVQSSADLSAWSNLSINISPNENAGRYTNSASGAKQFYRVARTSVASFDPVSGASGGGSSGILSVSPTSGSRGSTITLTISLNPDASPTPPPQTAPINSVTVGSITGTSDNHVSQTEVTTQITIPSNSATGAQTVSVVFPGPPGNPNQTVTYTLTGGFTIN